MLFEHSVGISVNTDDLRPHPFEAILFGEYPESHIQKIKNRFGTNEPYPLVFVSQDKTVLGGWSTVLAAREKRLKKLDVGQVDVDPETQHSVVNLINNFCWNEPEIMSELCIGRCYNILKSIYSDSNGKLSLLNKRRIGMLIANYLCEAPKDRRLLRAVRLSRLPRILHKFIDMEIISSDQAYQLLTLDVNKLNELAERVRSTSNIYDLLAEYLSPSLAA